MESKLRSFIHSEFAHMGSVQSHFLFILYLVFLKQVLCLRPAQTKEYLGIVLTLYKFTLIYELRRNANSINPSLIATSTLIHYLMFS